MLVLEHLPQPTASHGADKPPGSKVGFKATPQPSLGEEKPPSSKALAGKAASICISLSLIHISEPTRPY